MLFGGLQTTTTLHGETKTLKPFREYVFMTKPERRLVRAPGARRDHGTVVAGRPRPRSASGTSNRWRSDDHVRGGGSGVVGDSSRDAPTSSGFPHRIGDEKRPRQSKN